MLLNTSIKQRNACWCLVSMISWRGTAYLPRVETSLKGGICAPYGVGFRVSSGRGNLPNYPLWAGRSLARPASCEGQIMSLPTRSCHDDAAKVFRWYGYHVPVRLSTVPVSSPPPVSAFTFPAVSRK